MLTAMDKRVYQDRESRIARDAPREEHELASQLRQMQQTQQQQQQQQQPLRVPARKSDAASPPEFFPQAHREQLRPAATGAWNGTGSAFSAVSAAPGGRSAAAVTQTSMNGGPGYLAQAAIGLDNHSKQSPFRIVDQQQRGAFSAGPIRGATQEHSQGYPQRLTPGAFNDDVRGGGAEHPVFQHHLSLDTQHPQHAHTHQQQHATQEPSRTSPSTMLAMLASQQRTSPDLMGIVSGVVRNDLSFQDHSHSAFQHGSSALQMPSAAFMMPRGLFPGGDSSSTTLHHGLGGSGEEEAGSDLAGGFLLPGSSLGLGAAGGSYMHSHDSWSVVPTSSAMDSNTDISSATAGLRGLNVNAQPYTADYDYGRMAPLYSAPRPAFGQPVAHPAHPQMVSHYGGHMQPVNVAPGLHQMYSLQPEGSMGGFPSQHGAPTTAVAAASSSSDVLGGGGGGLGAVGAGGGSSALHFPYSTHLQPVYASGLGTGFTPHPHQQMQAWWQAQNGQQIPDPLSTNISDKTAFARPQEVGSAGPVKQGYAAAVQGSTGASHRRLPGSGNGSGSWQSSDSDGSAKDPRRTDKDDRRRNRGIAPVAAKQPEGRGHHPHGHSSGSVDSVGAAHRRAELVESPHTKVAYKDFYRQFRAKERESMDEACSFANAALQWMPEKSKWRIYLELADLAKRGNRVAEARTLYKKVCLLQPLASQGWLEWSKMEEECGNLSEALVILKQGLKECHFNESLLTKAIKQEERLHNLDEARALLARLKHEDVDKVWRAVLEGALLEARAGRTDVARKIYRYLIGSVPWYGPIYYEAYRLEEKGGHFQSAQQVILRGLEELPRYGPLWFGLLRLSERQDIEEEAAAWRRGAPPVLARVKETCEKAVHSISKELVWKVYFEAAQAEERAVDACASGRAALLGGEAEQYRDAMLAPARLCYCKSVLACPPNLRWKVWLAGARLEAHAGKMNRAKALLSKAFTDVPDKSRPYVYLECSRMEEFEGNLDGARQILSRARQDVPSEWKVFLETVMMEARANNWETALLVAKEALELHPGTGRLWAILIQMSHRLYGQAHGAWWTRETPASSAAADSCTDSSCGVHMRPCSSDLRTACDAVEIPHAVFLNALGSVPKSGEVWCEGARIHLNPLPPHKFNLATAQQYLNFAIQFTPQYGDSFVEYLRFEMLTQVFLPRVLEQLNLHVVWFFDQFFNGDEDGDSCGSRTVHARYRRSTAALEPAATQQVVENMLSLKYDLGIVPADFEGLDLSKLRRRCTNADPNYGAVWFYTRRRPFDIPTAVLQSAVHMLMHELLATDALYCRAIVGFIKSCLNQWLGDEDAVATAPKDVKQAVTAATRSIKAAEAIVSPDATSDFCGLLAHKGAFYSAADFVTGIISLNRLMFNRYLTAEERRQVLFGSDQIVA